MEAGITSEELVRQRTVETFDQLRAVFFFFSVFRNSHVLAGHDEGCIYIIVETDAQFVYLADGKIRTKDRPKRKKRKHVQLILKKYNVSEADDTAIKKILKDWKREEEK